MPVVKWSGPPPFGGKVLIMPMPSRRPGVFKTKVDEAKGGASDPLSDRRVP